jgi:hypothetical protein
MRRESSLDSTWPSPAEARRDACEEEDNMRSRAWLVVAGLALLVFSLLRGAAAAAPPDKAHTGNSELDRVIQGYKIAPVPLIRKGRDKTLLGLGSYIVNAQAACNDCHTNPPFAPGGDPFKGEPKKINVAGYLAGGRVFPTEDGGTVTSANITPDEDGKPAGLTFDEYRQLIRSGHDPDEPDELLQVMPWPVFQDMNDRDIRAIYEYLRSIPSLGEHD